MLLTLFAGEKIAYHAAISQFLMLYNDFHEMGKN